MNELTDQLTGSNVMAQSSSSREMEEVKGAIFLAKQFPRNVFQSEQRILDNCKRKSLAETAMYQYPKGGTKVTGPSIRLAEVIAQNWGNISFGVKELEQREGESTALAYAWDLETNVRQEKVFTVKHSIHTKSKGLKKLTDPRDIYELVANQGSRRVRACILSIIPGDIVDAAVIQCEDTLRGNSDMPLKDRVGNLLIHFKEKFSVTQDMIEDYFGYKVDSFTEIDLVKARNISTSLKDGMSKVEDWFEKSSKKSKEQNKLLDSFNEKEVEKAGEVVETEIEVDQGELPFD